MYYQSFNVIMKVKKTTMSDRKKAIQKANNSVTEIAEYFIWKSAQESKVITNKKLQKLVYYSQAWSVVLKNKKSFSEKIEAWVHGPAVRELYVKYKEFGFQPIKKIVDEKTISKISTEDRGLLDSVWNAYGGFDSSYLEMLTHSEKPWQDAREGLLQHQNSSNEISVVSLRDFYSAKLQEAQGK